MFSKSNKPVALRSTPSIIGANCSLAGDIVSEGEVHVDGKVVGDVRCVTLVIGEAGSITGEINAETVRVLGAVTGQITSRAVELAKTARILGDITHDSLAVEAGAYVEGRFNRLQADQPAASEQALVKTSAGIADKTAAETAAEALQPAKVFMLGN
jgi:cytoskeletal protein CcmA (bactofilin family)